MRTLNKIFKLDKEKFKIPRCVQDIIPIKAIWEDGIFQVSKNKFPKSFKFMDINYAVASKEDKEAMFLDYSDLLNSLDVGAITKITIKYYLHAPFNCPPPLCALRGCAKDGHECGRGSAHCVEMREEYRYCDEKVR